MQSTVDNSSESVHYESTQQSTTSSITDTPTNTNVSYLLLQYNQHDVG